MLVIDVMVYVGVDKDVIDFFDIYIICVGNKFIIFDGMLVGSCLDMYGVIINCVNDIGILLEEVSFMVSVMFFVFMGINEKVGSIVVG